ncbi:hypothetical protein ACOSQ2_018614 [Xanthoceras sorbifolium]
MREGYAWNIPFGSAWPTRRVLDREDASREMRRQDKPGPTPVSTLTLASNPTPQLLTSGTRVQGPRSRLG